MRQENRAMPRCRVGRRCAGPTLRVGRHTECAYYLLLVAEGFEGVEEAGAAGGVEAEEDADGGGEEEGEKGGFERDDDGPLGAAGEVVDEHGEGDGAGAAEGEADNAPDAGEEDGFDEEL